MGGSLGMALRERRLAGTVVGWDRSAETLTLAEQRGTIDRGIADLAEAVRAAAAIFLAVPVGALPELMERIAPHVQPEALVSDLGSVKSEIVAVGTRLFGPRFVGGHPMAGSEQGGIVSARSDLFTGVAWAVVPPVEASSRWLDRLMALISALEAHALLLDAATHDRLVALVSHLPHLLSFAFSATVRSDPQQAIATQLAGGSYRDMTRVSASDPALWRDIFLANREFVLAALTHYEQRLVALKQGLEDGEPFSLERLLSSL